jgi:hypothetical protein
MGEQRKERRKCCGVGHMMYLGAATAVMGISDRSVSAVQLAVIPLARNGMVSCGAGERWL